MFPLPLLQQLATLQGLSLTPDANKVLDRLESCLERYSELELRSDARRIDLVTYSYEMQVVEDFLRLLADRGAPASHLAPPGSLLRFGGGAGMGMKIPLTETTSGGELYLRRAIDLDELESYLTREGATPEAVDQVLALAKVFDKDYVHMLGADAHAPSRLSVFFTTYLEVGQEESDETLLARALELVGVAPAGIDAFCSLHRGLGVVRPETLYFTVRIAGGQTMPGAKVDYVAVPLESLARLPETLLSSSQDWLPVVWGRWLGTDRSSYAGILLDSSGPCSARVYFDDS